MSTKTRELKGEDYFICEDCLKETDDFFLYTDDHYNITICEDCFNIRFAKEQKAKNLQWFKDNFNESEYPKEFWESLES